MRINPGLQVLSLVEDAIQIGTGQRARWITGLSVDEKRFVLSLGQGGGGSPPAPVNEPGPARRAEILSMLAPVLLDSPAPSAADAVAGHGLGGRLVPDVLAWTASYAMDAVEVLRHRTEARVAVHGCGRMGQLLAHILAAAGVGGLLLVDPESIDAGDLGAGTTGITSVGSGRARATARSLQPIYPQLRVAETAVRDPAAEALDMAVIVSGGNLPRLETLTEDAAMLPVLFTDSGMHLGPLCLPGLTLCAQCAWEQCDPTLRMLREGTVVPAVLRPESSLAALAAGMAAMQVLMVLDRINIPSAAGAMILCDLPTGSTTSVPARARPHCHCLDPVAA